MWRQTRSKKARKVNDAARKDIERMVFLRFSLSKGELAYIASIKVRYEHEKHHHRSDKEVKLAHQSSFFLPFDDILRRWDLDLKLIVRFLVIE